MTRLEKETSRRRLLEIAAFGRAQAVQCITFAPSVCEASRVYACIIKHPGAVCCEAQRFAARRQCNASRLPPPCVKRRVYMHAYSNIQAVECAPFAVRGTWMRWRSCDPRHPQQSPWISPATSTEFPWKSPAASTELPSNVHGITLEIPSKARGFPLEIPSNVHGIPAQSGAY